MENSKIDLINQAKSGNIKSLEKIIKAEQNNIYTTLFYLKKDDIELYDIMQDVLIKLTKKISNLNNPESFKTWLNKIIVNSYYDYERRNKNRKRNVQFKADSFDIPDNKNNPLNEIMYTELDFTIKKTIENMPIHYKIPITLREVQGLSYENISKITSTSIGTVKSRIARARGIIKNEIKRYTG